MVRKKSKQGAHLKGASTSRFNGENKSSREWLDSEDDTKDADFVESDGAEDEPDDTSDDEMSIEIAQTLRARADRTSAGKRLRSRHHCSRPPHRAPCASLPLSAQVSLRAELDRALLGGGQEVCTAALRVLACGPALVHPDCPEPVA